MFTSNKSNSTSFLRFLLSTWFHHCMSYMKQCCSPKVILKATNYRHCQKERENERVRDEHTCQNGFPLAGWHTFRIFIHKHILNFTKQLKLFNTIPESSCRKSGCLSFSHSVPWRYWVSYFNASTEMQCCHWNSPHIYVKHFEAWHFESLKLEYEQEWGHVMFKVICNLFTVVTIIFAKIA